MAEAEKREFVTLLEQYAASWHGFGNLCGPHWYVGLEEGGDDDLRTVLTKLRNWDHGSKAQDLNPPGRTAPAKYFRPACPVLQPTWSKLIRFHQGLTGERAIDREDVRAYQARRLGRPDSDHALLELMPLPSQGASKWNYMPLEDVAPFLASRKCYEERFLDTRVRLLKEAMNSQVRTVLFYGSHRAWKAISETQLQTVNDLPFLSTAKVGSVVYCSMPHPVRHGQANWMWDQAGRHVRTLLD